MTTGKTIDLTRWTFVNKIMSLLFNMLSRLIITFFLRCKCLLIWFYQLSLIRSKNTNENPTVSFFLYIIVVLFLGNSDILIVTSNTFYLSNSFILILPLKKISLGAGEEGDGRGWDGWMASLTRWTWVWVNSGSWWWTGRPHVLRFMGLQSRTRLSNWTELI